MGLQMVDSRQGELQGVRYGFGHGHAHHQGADEAGTLRGGHAVHITQTHPGLVQGPLDHRHDVFQVPPGRQFRHHPAIHRVEFELGGHHTSLTTAARP